SDTGGYLRQSNFTRELFARWIEFSVYCPVMEVMAGPGRTPWTDFDPAFLEITRASAATHHDLIPYVRSRLAAASRGRMPVMRPLISADPHDQNPSGLRDEPLCGGRLLDAPERERAAVTRPVTLPAGRWIDCEGGQSICERGPPISAVAPLSRIPVFVREC